MPRKPREDALAHTAGRALLVSNHIVNNARPGVVVCRGGAATLRTNKVHDLPVISP